MIDKGRSPFPLLLRIPTSQDKKKLPNLRFLPLKENNRKQLESNCLVHCNSRTQVGASLMITDYARRTTRGKCCSLRCYGTSYLYSRL